MLVVSLCHSKHGILFQSTLNDGKSFLGCGEGVVERCAVH